MFAALGLLIFELEGNANEPTGESRMKMRTGAIFVLLLAAIPVVGFGALRTSKTGGCEGESSGGCSHETPI